MEIEMERSRFLFFAVMPAILACWSAFTAFEMAVVRWADNFRLAFALAFPRPEPAAALWALAGRREPVQGRVEVSAFLMRSAARWPARKGPWRAGQGPTLSLA